MKKLTLGLIILTTLGTSCSRVTTKSSLLIAKIGNAVGLSEGPLPGEEEVIQPTSEGTVALKHFGQISLAMAQVTNVSPMDPLASPYYQAQKARFSADGGANGITPSMLMATTSLAGIYCSKLVAADANQATPSLRLAHSSVDFSKGTAALTDAIRSQVATSYYRLFLRRDPSAAEIKILNDAMIEAAAAKSNTGAALDVNSTNVMRSVLIMGCTSVLGSGEFIQL